MKSLSYIWITAALAAGALWLLFHKSHAQTPQQPEPVVTEVTNRNISTPTKKALPANNASNNDPSVNSSGLPSNIDEFIAKGSTGKVPTMREIYLEENKSTQDIYGKVIDQYGQPIANAAVTGELVLSDGTYGGVQVKKFNAESDGDGLFDFTNIRGAGFSVRINKEGYKMGDRGEGRIAPVGSKSSQTDRATFIMWKIRGNEPLVQSVINANLSSEVNAVTFDMITGKQTPDGDLKITFSRFPSKLRPGLVHPYDWQFKIEMVNGGLVQENDPYPYWAPESGYQPSFEFEISSNSVPWQNQFEQNFYIKNSTGKYGLMRFLIYSASRPPQIQVNFIVNPSGSQNLEPDFSK